MGKRKRRQHAETSLLRLVRPEDGPISDQHVAARCASEAISGIRNEIASNGIDNKEESGNHVDSAADGRADVVIRSFNADEANLLFNDPSVYPLVANGLEKIDVTPLIQNPVNVFLIVNGGGIFFFCQEPGLYEVHTAFLENFRGLNAIRASQAAYRWMFTHTDCMSLVTRVPEINPAAEKFCQIVGATREFERKAIWDTKDGKVGMSFWSLRYDDWVRKTPSLKFSGKEFHERLLSERKRLGYSEALHDDEDCHDLHVGACAEMIYGGQLDKAIILYNRWARFAGYGLISLISREPALIDIGDALLQVTGNTFKVILVR